MREMPNIPHARWQCSDTLALLYLTGISNCWHKLWQRWSKCSTFTGRHTSSNVARIGTYFAFLRYICRGQVLQIAAMWSIKKKQSCGRLSTCNARRRLCLEQSLQGWFDAFFRSHLQHPQGGGCLSATCGVRLLFGAKRSLFGNPSGSINVAYQQREARFSPDAPSILIGMCAGSWLSVDRSLIAASPSKSDDRSAYDTLQSRRARARKHWIEAFFSASVLAFQRTIKTQECVDCILGPCGLLEPSKPVTADCSWLEPTGDKKKLQFTFMILGLHYVLQDRAVESAQLSFQLQEPPTRSISFLCATVFSVLGPRRSGIRSHIQWRVAPAPSLAASGLVVSTCQQLSLVAAPAVGAYCASSRCILCRASTRREVRGDSRGNGSTCNRTFDDADRSFHCWPPVFPALGRPRQGLASAPRHCRRYGCQLFRYTRLLSSLLFVRRGGFPFGSPTADLGFLAHRLCGRDGLLIFISFFQYAHYSVRYSSGL